MFSLDLGYALWYPEPDELTGEPQIGDVGYMDDGAFIRLFNVDTSNEAHAVTYQWKPTFTLTESNVPSPDVFATLSQRRRPIEPGPYPSHGVRERDMGGSLSAGFSGASADISAGYTCKEVQGGLLVLQSEADYAKVLAVAHLKTYMARYHDSWLAYARDVGLEVGDEDVVLVGGWVKTSADWKTMAFSNHSTKHHISLKGRVTGLLGLGIHASDSKAKSGATSHRQGPEYQNTNRRPRANASKNQAVFLKRYKVKRRLAVLKTIIAGAGYDRLPGGGASGHSATEIAVSAAGEDRSSGEDGIQWLEDKIVDPLDILLDYILEISDANVAVACDLDLESIVGLDCRWPVDFATYLRKVQPPVDLSNRHGAISIPALLSQEHVNRLEKRLIKIADIRKWPHISLNRAGTPSRAPVHFHDASRAPPDVPSKWRYLRFQGPERSYENLHPAMASSSDGTLLAAVSDTRQIVVWRLSDGLSVQTLGDGRQPGPVITAIVFSPDSQHIASCADDRTVTIWDVSSGRAMRHLAGHQAPVEHVLYVAQGTRLATASSDSVVKIWDASTGSPLCQFSHSEAVTRLLASQDGRYMAVKMVRAVVVYDTLSLVQLATLECPDGAKVAAVTFDSFQQRLFISDNRGRGSIYSTADCTVLKVLNNLSSNIRSATFAPNKDTLAVTYSQRVEVFGENAALQRPFHLGVFVNAIAISSDGEFLAAAGGENAAGCIKVWSMRSRELVVGYDPPLSDFFDIKFSPDSKELLTFATDGQACLWSVRDALRMH
ncbi:WD40 repeat domain-containing protein [Phanerochaete sordida]|uniref:WD40 repeat domain-containing protein n=1 Tax=Phanerochaete sordida TaxID=48140 RepID=A0A9P3GIN3_9APHY|nr:WD40 repeat domain-containing protein [Phanerochaete sordida]